MADGLPPWLNVTPSDFLRAREAGASTGLQIASLNQRAAIEAEQLGQAAQAEQDRIMLAEQQMQIHREQSAQQAARLAHQQEMLNAYRTAQLGLGQSRIDQAKKAAEEKRNAAALGMANIYKFADVLKTTGDPMLAWQLAPGVPATSASAMARAHKESQPVTVTEGRTTISGVPFVAGGGRFQLIEDAQFNADMTVLKQEHASELARQRNMTDEEDLKKSRDRAADIARQMRELASSRGQRRTSEPPAAGAPGRPAGVVYPWERSAMPVPLVTESPEITVTPADIAPPATTTATEPAPAAEPAWKKIKIRTQADADLQIDNARKAIERAPSQRDEILARLREALREGGFALKEGE